MASECFTQSEQDQFGLIGEMSIADIEGRITLHGLALPESWHVIDASSFFRLGNNIVGTPATATRGVARTHYTLGATCQHWQFSPQGILRFRAYLKMMTSHLTIGMQVPVLRPTVVASWKRDSIDSAALGKLESWEKEPDPPLLTRLILDLDPIKDAVFADDFKPYWPEIADDAFEIISQFVEEPIGDRGAIYAFEGRFGAGDKPFSAHLVYSDYALEPGKIPDSLVTALREYFQQYQLDFDKSPWTSGLKYPFMDKWLPKLRRYRGRASALVYATDPENVSFGRIFSCCDPLVLPSHDTAVTVLQFKPEQPARRRSRALPAVVHAAPVELDDQDEAICEALVAWYRDQWDSGACLQTDYPRKTTQGCLLLFFRDSREHKCAHVSNNHKIVWFSGSRSGQLKCLGADSRTNERINFADIRFYGHFPADADDGLCPMEVDQPATKDPYQAFRDWLLDRTEAGYMCSPSTPIFQCEFEASSSTLAVIEDHRDRLLDDHTGTKWLISMEWFMRMATDEDLNFAQRLACCVQYFNLYMCFVTTARKYFIRPRPRSFLAVEEKALVTKLKPFRLFEMGKEKATPFFQLWKQHELSCCVDEIQVCPSKLLTLYPCCTEVVKQFVVPEYSAPCCLQKFNDASVSDQRRIQLWWRRYMRQLVGLTQPATETTNAGRKLYLENCADFLSRWVCEVMFRGEPLKMAVYLCDEMGGAGKTLLWKLMEALIGTRYVKAPDSFDSFVNDKWRTDYIGCQLLCFDDAMHNIKKEKAAAHYKSLITCDRLQVEQKFGDKYSVAWFGNVFICTNKRFSIPGVTRDERRTFAVVSTKRWLVGVDEADELWENVAQFLHFGWDELYKNPNGQLDLLVGYLFNLYSEEFEAMPPIALWVPSLQSSIISGQQGITENPVATWIRERWEEHGNLFTFVGSAPIFHRAGYRVPVLCGWPDDVVDRDMVLQTIPCSLLHKQFMIDMDRTVTAQWFVPHFKKEWNLFMQNEYVDAYPEQISFVESKRRRAEQYEPVQNPDGEWSWSIVSKKPQKVRSFTLTYPPVQSTLSV